MKIIDTAFKNYAAMPPLEKAKVKAAWTGIGGFFLYLLYTAYTEGLRDALGIFLAVTIFCIVATIAAFIGHALGKIFGAEAGTTIGAVLILGFIGFVLYIIVANWG